MGIFDKAKDLLGGHADKINQGIDKAADIADEKTGGKYSQHIDTGVEKAKDVVEKLDDSDSGTTTP